MIIDYPEFTYDAYTKQLLIEFTSSPFTFKLTGSYRFNALEPKADIDFITPDNINVANWLYIKGLWRKDNISSTISVVPDFIDATVVKCYTYDNQIHVLLIEPIFWDARVKAEQDLFNSGILTSMSKQDRAKVWAGISIGIVASMK